MAKTREQMMTTLKTKYHKLFVFIEGSLVGVITGIVGAGGGFIIIPVLVIFSKLKMKNAVATSLLIISIKSLIGFIGDIESLKINWIFLLKFSIISIIGISIGQGLSKKIDGSKLKKGFGLFVIVIGTIVLIKEVI